MPDSSALLNLISECGIAAQHSVPDALPPLVAPTAAAELNRLKILVAPVGCWRVDDLCFDFDSSFPGPRIGPGMRHLTRLLQAHPPPSQAQRGDPAATTGCPLSVFAHADPVGDDDYNKQLSGRRATAIYGLLTHDAALWDTLYAQPLGNDRWSSQTIQAMLDATAADGSADVQQVAQDSARRRQLYADYMETLWPSAQRLQKSDFLGGGADAGGKADYQGCSEFNPLWLPSQAEQQAFAAAQDKTARNAANAVNRRVMVLIFRKGSQVDAALWPCPRVGEGVGACRKRFWSDGEQRRGKLLPDGEREYAQARDTFACRFYDRLVGASPCERILRVKQIRLYDPAGKALPNARYQVTLEGVDPVAGSVGADAILTLRDVKVPATCSVRWAPPADPGKTPAPDAAPPDYIYGLEMYLSIADADSNEEARMKLNNLGYARGELADSVKAFQHDYAALGSPPLGESGELDAETLRVLREVYRQCADDLHATEIGG